MSFATKHYLGLVIFILLLFYFFRNEISCNFNKYHTVCISYNRITGTFSIPIDEHYSFRTRRSRNEATDAAPKDE